MSLVFTDPKGELYRKLTKYLETKGYDVKVFNLVNPTFQMQPILLNLWKMKRMQKFFLK